MKMISILAASASALAITAASAHRVDVFVANQTMTAPQNSNAINDVTVYDLSTLSHYMQALKIQVQQSAKAGGIARSKSVMKQYLAEHHSAFKKSAKGLGLALMYQIKGTPTVVIDGKYQIVDTDNVGLALQAYKRWMGSKG